MPLDPQLADLLAFIAAAGYPPMEEGTPDDARRGMRALSCDMVQPADVVPVREVTELTVPGGDGDRPARLYRPEVEGPTPTVVYFHGGGYVIGDLDTHDQTCRRLCRDTGATVLSVDYRLAPEHPFPAGIQDAITAARWAADHLADLGGSGVLAVAGDSAGGNFSAGVAQALGDRLAAQLLIYPATDALTDYPSKAENAEGYFLTGAMVDWFGANYVGGVDLDLADARLTPMLGEVSGVAPAVVVTAEFDPLRDEGEAYADKLRAAGVHVDAVRYDGLIHGFVDMVGFSAASAAAVSDLHRRFAALLAAADAR